MSSYEEEVAFEVIKPSGVVRQYLCFVEISGCHSPGSLYDPPSGPEAILVRVENESGKRVPAREWESVGITREAIDDILRRALEAAENRSLSAWELEHDDY